MQTVVLAVVAFAVAANALNSESNLQDSWLQQITGVSHTESSGAISYDFTQGRATNYQYNQAGACGYGPIFPDESLGNPLYILAIPDCSPLFPGEHTYTKGFPALIASRHSATLSHMVNGGVARLSVLRV